MIDGTIPVHNFAKDDPTSIPFKYSALEQDIHQQAEPHHRHNFCEIFIFTKGTGTHTIDFKEYAIEPNTIHFVAPGQVHQVSRSADSSGHVIFFSRDFLLSAVANKHLLFELPFLNNYAPLPALQIELNDLQEVDFIIDKLKRESIETANLNKEVAGSYLHTLLLLCLRIYQAQAPHNTSTKKPDLLSRFQALLESAYLQEHGVAYYADKLAVTAKSLNLACKTALGKTASDMIYDRLILEAKRLLLHSALSIKEIAYHLHFQDPAHFSKFFKNQTGQSPTDLNKG